MVACNKLATPVDAAVGKENWCKRFKQVWGLRVRLSYCLRVDGPFGFRAYRSIQAAKVITELMSRRVYV